MATAWDVMPADPFALAQSQAEAEKKQWDIGKKEWELEKRAKDLALLKAEPKAEATPADALAAAIAPAATGLKPDEYASIYGPYENRVRGMYNDPEYAALAAKLGEYGANRTEAAKQGLSLAQQQIEAFKTMPQQMDLSALAKLTDQWTGSNLAQAYNRPVSPMERMEAMYKLQQAVQKANVGISESEQAMLENQLKQKSADRTLGINTELALMGKRQAAEGSSAAKSREKSIELTQKEKYQKEFGENFRGLTDLVAKTSRMAEIVEANGGKLPRPGTPDFSEFESLQSQASTIYNRDQAKLGALSGPDLKLILDSLQGSSSYLGGQIRNLLASKGGVANTLRSIENEVDAKFDALAPTIKSRYQGLADEDFNISKDYYSNMKKGRYFGGKVNSDTLPVGTEKKGYRFKGGDPSKQENWEKI